MGRVQSNGVTVPVMLCYSYVMQVLGLQYQKLLDVHAGTSQRCKGGRRTIPFWWNLNLAAVS